MLSFAVYTDNQPASKVNLSGAYVVGSDDVPLRADISFKNGVITCAKKSAGPAGLALLWPVAGAGEIMLETVRLLERDKPYILPIELARGRLVRVNQKLEDWGLLGYGDAEPILEVLDQARGALIQALQANGPDEAFDRGEAALEQAVKASELLTRFHAEALLQRRKQMGGIPRRAMGCSIHPQVPTELTRRRIAGCFDFVSVPIVWRDIEPSEQTFNWKPLDAWVETLSKNRIAMKGSSLLSFSKRNIPDWLHIWEHDFDAIRDLAFEHARRVINRYSQYIQVWDVISGIHANNCFLFNFEQLMELTRMTAALAKQTCPRGTAVIDIAAPWGEYYARNQRTIPPLLYADMTSQSGVKFDAFGLQLCFGPGVDGMFVRDLFQISSQLDLFGKLGQPIHITAVQVPSSPNPPDPRPDGAQHSLDGGQWRQPWSEEAQAQWLNELMHVALSKPFVESVCWHNLVDDDVQPVMHGALLRSDLAPKAAFNQWTKVRSEIMGSSKRATRSNPA